MPKTDDIVSKKRGLKSLPIAAIILLGAAACAEKERSFVDNISDGDISPTMTTLEVETFISDSGYTRYHLSTPVWMMYDDASEPFWRFPDGLDMQQYDLELKPDASMVCDSAIYYSRKRLWRLDGHVVMVNTLRDTFLSQQLFWDQAQRKVYTDSFVHIVRSDRTIEGYGLTANENMTAYTINRPTAIIPVNRREQPETDGSNTTVQTDSVVPDSTNMTVDTRRRKAPVRRHQTPSASPSTPVSQSSAPLQLKTNTVR